MTMRRSFTTTEGHDTIEMRQVTATQAVLDLKVRPTAILNVDEIEVIRDIFDHFAKAMRAAQKG